VPRLRFAGANRTFASAGALDDDCEVDLSDVEAVGYHNLAASGRRQIFQPCGTATCETLNQPLLVREEAAAAVRAPCGAGASVQKVLDSAGKPTLHGPRIAYHFNGVHILEPGPDGRFTTLADNTDRLLPHAPFVAAASPVALSGDFAVWIDSTTNAARVMLGDLADGSVRCLSTTSASNRAPTIAGDVVVFATDDLTSATGGEVYAAWTAVEPVLARDRRNAAPTAQRCPEDDIFEENDSTLTATRLNSGAAVNAIVCRDDADVFAIDVPAGCAVRAQVAFRHADGNVDVELLDPNGQRVAASLGTGNLELIDRSSAAGGLHSVRVFAVGSAENTYDISVSVSCPP
jgi:hypothetical protein